MKKIIIGLVMVLTSAFTKAQNNLEVGSGTGNGYFYVIGDTNTDPNSKLRLVKWSTGNAHLDVWDSKNLYFNYYKGGHVYFGNGQGAAHSVFTNSASLAINKTNPESGFNLDVNGKSIMNYLTIRSTSDIEGGELALKGAAGYNDWKIDNYKGNFRLSHSGNEYFKMKSNGYVGIGTSNPSSKLDVNGKIKTTELLVNYSSTTSKYPVIGQITYSGPERLNGEIVFPHFQIKNNSGPQVTYQFRALDANGTSRYFNVAYNATTNFFSLSGEKADTKVYIRNKVGIGTTNPTEKLTVNGNVRAEEIIVEDVEGADFVFEEDYDLRSLSETEAFIKENKHLPEIPSAASMAENGLGLKDMNILLLQKVEELTLHLIQQEKEKNVLHSSMNELKARIEALERE